MKIRLLILSIVFFGSMQVFAQDLSSVDTTEFDIFKDTPEGYSLIEEVPLTIDMENEVKLSEEAKEARKRREEKRNKKVFYGLKTKKGFVRRGTGENVELEVFRYLKDFKDVDPYVPQIYWYDFSRKRIRNTGQIEGKGVVLHGPYKRFVGEQLVEEGIFYKGAKNGRWTTYNNNDVLMSKIKYYKGWPKESQARYYDDKHTKLREVIPIVYGKKEGMYYYFHENGDVAVKGEYKEGVKIGKWTEYYPFMRRMKKEIQYPADPYDRSYQPYISREWDRSSKLVYEAKF